MFLLLMLLSQKYHSSKIVKTMSYWTPWQIVQRQVSVCHERLVMPHFSNAIVYKSFGDINSVVNVRDFFNF